MLTRARRCQSTAIPMSRSPTFWKYSKPSGAMISLLDICKKNGRIAFNLDRNTQYYNSDDYSTLYGESQIYQVGPFTVRNIVSRGYNRDVDEDVPTYLTQIVTPFGDSSSSKKIRDFRNEIIDSFENLYSKNKKGFIFKKNKDFEDLVRSKGYIKLEDKVDSDFLLNKPFEFDIDPSLLERSFSISK